MKIITKEYLKSHPDEIFVFGDNQLHVGKGGAAILRDEPNVYGFITKKYPSHDNFAYYMPLQYKSVFRKELDFLKQQIRVRKNKKFLISKLGAGLANKYRIWELVIEPVLKKELSEFPNVEFLW